MDLTQGSPQAAILPGTRDSAPAPESTAPSPPREIRSLNTLRGLAALIVVISHYSNRSGIWHDVLGQGAGQIGVMLFFILSGFLMSHLYLHRDFTSLNVKKYFVARCARVVPLFVAVVLVSFLVFQLGINTNLAYDIKTPAALLSHLLLLSGTSVLWTIPAEIQFYLLFVLLWYLRARGRALLGIAVAALLVADFLLGFPDTTFTILGLFGQTKLLVGLPCFLAGLILGELHRQYHPGPRWRRHSYVLILLLIPLLYPKVCSTLFGYEHRMFKDMGVVLVLALIFACLIFFVPATNPLLANRAGDHLGAISYSLYLLHLPLLKWLYPFVSNHPVPGLLVFLAASITLASISYWLLELPSRRLIRSTG